MSDKKISSWTAILSKEDSQRKVRMPCFAMLMTVYLSYLLRDLYRFSSVLFQYEIDGKVRCVPNLLLE
jgi:hypothetical protein